MCLAEPEEELFGLWLQVRPYVACGVQAPNSIFLGGLSISISISINVNLDVQWTDGQGLPLDHAVKRRLALMQEAVRRSQHLYLSQQQQLQQSYQADVSINRSTSSSSSLLLMGGSATVAALVAEDLVDDFRAFDAMETYLYQVFVCLFIGDERKDDAFIDWWLTYDDAAPRTHTRYSPTCSRTSRRSGRCPSRPAGAW